MLKLEHEALAEEGCDCWVFVDACSGSLVDLSLQSPWGTDVSLAAPYWQCATGHYASYHSTTSPSGQRTTVNSLPTPSVKDAGIPTRAKQQCQPGNNDAKTRRRGSASLDIISKSIPAEGRKREAPCKAPQGESSGSLQKRLQPHPNY